MKIKCIIIDDEPLAVKLLENHISKISELQLVATGTNAMEAYKILQTQQVDLLFLDIQMPNLNGIDFLKSLKSKPQTIFTTAFRDYALEGFELEAVDYLLKPITFQRFFQSVDRVLRNKAKDHEEDFVIVKVNGFNRKIKLDEIIYFESQGNDIRIILGDENFLASKISIAELADRLQNKGFVRIHRSFIINSKWVSAINNNEILLEQFTIPVGRSYKNEFDRFVKIFLEKRLF
ncbi:response regulator transcription factor [Chryseobacterium sp. MYb264]|uniref:LytR/AlgR family response regulator transcription factor n=1 Tax=Chryseobacterium sp. MYb264 TaxID=2745153 RepID=UPI002E0D9472|nr:response regulator transcription factor [Chryseobacterium sp. MYb264]